MERDWVDYVSAGGNIATALTFLYVVIKEITTGKQVQDLTIVATELKEQNRLIQLNLKEEARPSFELPKVRIEDYQIIIPLKNKGRRTKILDHSIRMVSEGILFLSTENIAIKQNATLNIIGMPKGIKPLEECDYYISFVISDIYKIFM